MVRKTTNPDSDLRHRVEPILNEWIERLGLSGSWEISYSFVEKFEQEGIAANVTFQGPYKVASIEFARKAVRDCCTERDLEYMITHELVHIKTRELIAPLERVVSPDTMAALNPFAESLADSITISLMHGKYPKDYEAHYHEHK